MFAASLAVAVIGLAGCSSDDPASGPEAAGDTAASSTSAAPAPERTCDQGATTDELETAPVDGIESDLTLTSHDGTEIRMHWFPADGVSADAPLSLIHISEPTRPY